MRRHWFDDLRARRHAAAALRRIKCTGIGRRPFDCARFCEAVSAVLGRRVHPIGFSELIDGLPPAGLTGLWIPYDGIDYVVYYDLASPLFGWHCLFHEIGHMLLGHYQPDQPNDAALRMLHTLRPGSRHESDENAAQASDRMHAPQPLDDARYLCREQAAERCAHELALWLRHRPFLLRPAELGAHDARVQQLIDVLSNPVYR